jgi:solute:Na+ symporter, SSS family
LAFSIVVTFTIVSLYCCVSICIAYASARFHRSSNDYLNATGALPTWVASISFLACNCGALEVLGLSGIAFRYGVQAFHFYWIGAIPALIFLSFVMIPAYLQSGARSMPEYFGQRFGPKVRLLNAFAILIASALYTGISLYGLAEVTHITMNWPFLLAILVFGSIVLAYVLIGGFRATVYNEVLQFLFMLAGLLPLLYFSHKAHYGGFIHAGQYWHMWRETPIVSSTSQLDLVGVLVGLGGVISFSYWCTDYGLVQRALTARDLESARKVPLIAGFGKLLFAIVVVVPVILMSGHIQAKPGAALDETSPALIATLYGRRLLGVGIAALIAGLLNSLAANISAFSSLWTGEIYRPFLSSERPESHYRNVGRVASISCVAIGIFVALWTRSFENLSAFVLLIFSLFVIPFFAVLLSGVISRRTTATSAVAGAGAGILAGGGIQLAFAERWLPSGSRLSANFHSAIVSFAAAALVCNAGHLLSLLRRSPIQPVNIDAMRPTRPKASITVWCLAGTLLVVCVVANVLWW